MRRGLTRIRKKKLIRYETKFKFFGIVNIKDADSPNFYSNVLWIIYLNFTVALQNSRSSFVLFCSFNFFWKQCWIAEFVLKFTINPSKNFVDHLSSGLLLVTVHCSYIYNYSPAKNINVGVYTTKKYIPNQVYHNYLNFNKNYTRNIYFSMAQMKTDSKK